MTRDVKTESLGPAGPAIRIFQTRLLADDLYFVTRSVHPTRLGVFDPEERAVTDHYAFESGEGAWCTAEFDGDLYVGTYYPADVYRFDPGRGDLSFATGLGEDTYTCDLEPHGRKIYAGTYPSATLYEYDPATGDCRELGSVSDTERYARSVQVTDDRFYVGVGATPHLYVIERDTWEKRDILPESLRGEATIRQVSLADDVLLFLTSPSRELIVMDRDDHGSYRRVETGREVVSYELDDGVAYLATADPNEDSGGTVLHRYDLAEDELEDLGAVPHRTFDVARRDDTFVGATLPGVVWEHDVRTNETAATAVEDAGMPLGAELPFSLAVLEGTPVVAGHGSIHVHEGGDAPWRVDSPAEAKAMTAVGETLYLAIYPDARLARFTKSRGEVDVLTRIGHEQNRPRAVHYHEATGRLLVGTKPDYGHLGGAISAYDPETGGLTVRRDVIADQSVRSVTALGDTAVLGSEIYGEQVEPVATEARVVGWNPETEEAEWEIVPVAGAEAVTDLVALNDLVIGTASDGTLFAIDPGAAEVIYRSAVLPGGADLAVRNGFVYGVTGSELFRVDPATGSTTTLLSDLNPATPLLTAGAGNLYAIEGYDLIRVTP